MKNTLSTIMGHKKLKISDLQKNTGISRTTLHDLYYEKSLNPDTKTVMTLCNFLDVTPDEFFGFKNLNI
ncbi:helix-turn-helix domain-containing protein [Macrococcus animalis]|uniref:helix-turn-helix domain-containing protein n=1 Tax=Macrococcus animalis TaxID=3395467 RepID=UPI0039BDA417